jgi:uncharacterized small protein (DUF1192 family)
MKRLVLLLALVSLTAFAEGIHDKRIAEIKAEIAQRQAAIDQMKAQGLPTGRQEFPIFRLKAELAKLEDMNIEISKN